MATRNLGQKVPKFKENLKLRNFVTYPIQEAKFYVVTTPRDKEPAENAAPSTPCKTTE